MKTRNKGFLFQDSKIIMKRSLYDNSQEHNERLSGGES